MASLGGYNQEGYLTLQLSNTKNIYMKKWFEKVRQFGARNLAISQNI